MPARLAKGGGRHGEVKMANHKHGVMQVDVRAGGSQVEPGQATESENENHPQREKHRDGEADGAPVQGAQPIEEEDLRWEADEERQYGETLPQKRIHPRLEHVVPIDETAEDGDRAHGQHRSLVPMRGLAAEESQEVGGDAPRR